MFDVVGGQWRAEIIGDSESTRALTPGATAYQSCHGRGMAPRAAAALRALIALAATGFAFAGFTVSISPSSLFAGDYLRLTWSAPSATTPLTLKLYGASCAAQWLCSGFQTLVTSERRSDSANVRLDTSLAPGSYFVGGYDDGYWTTTYVSPAPYLTVRAPAISVASVSPSSFYAGDRVTVSWATSGPLSGPFTIAIVGYTFFQVGAWTWPGCTIATVASGSSAAVTIPAALVSYGSYVIVVKASDDTTYGSSIVTVRAPSLSLTDVVATTVYPGESIAFNFTIRGYAALVPPLTVGLCGSVSTVVFASVTVTGSSGSGVLSVPFDVTTLLGSDFYVQLYDAGLPLVAQWLSNAVSVSVQRPSLTGVAVEPLTVASLGDISVTATLSRGLSAPLRLYVCFYLDPFCLSTSTNAATGDAAITRRSNTAPGFVRITVALPLRAATYGSYVAWLESANGYTTSSAPFTVVTPPTNPVATFNATDALRPLMWAAWAYSPPLPALGTLQPPAPCSASSSWGFAAVASPSALRYLDDAVSGAFGMAFRNGDGTVVVAFRGTEGGLSIESCRDVMTDLNAVLTSYAGCAFGAAVCSVHAGFLAQYNALASQLDAALRALIPAAERATTPVVVTGHSLGGAMATLAAYEVALAGYYVRGVYTFGSPRVGDAAFAVAFQQIVARGSGGGGLLAGEALISFPAIRVGNGTAGGAAGRSRRVLQTEGPGGPPRPSSLLVTAARRHGADFPETVPANITDGEFWALWETHTRGVEGLHPIPIPPVQQRQPSAPHSAYGSGGGARRLQASSGNTTAAAQLTGVWRVAGVYDIVTFLPPNISTYQHVTELVALDPVAPGAFTRTDVPMRRRQLYTANEVVQLSQCAAVAGVALAALLGVMSTPQGLAFLAVVAVSNESTLGAGITSHALTSYAASLASGASIAGATEGDPMVTLRRSGVPWVLPGGTACTRSPSNTPVSTPSNSAASTPSGTAASTPSGTAASTPSRTAASTPSGTAASTPSGTAASTPSGTAASTPSRTAASTPSGTAASTPSGTAASTPSGTAASTPSGTATHSSTGSQTGTPSSTATSSACPDGVTERCPWGFTDPIPGSGLCFNSGVWANFSRADGACTPQPCSDPPASFLYSENRAWAIYYARPTLSEFLAADDRTRLTWLIADWGFPDPFFAGGLRGWYMSNGRLVYGRYVSGTSGNFWSVAQLLPAQRACSSASSSSTGTPSRTSTDSQTGTPSSSGTGTRSATGSQTGTPSFSGTATATGTNLCPVGWQSPPGSSQCFAAYSFDPGVSVSTMNTFCADRTGGRARLASLRVASEFAFVSTPSLCGLAYPWPWQNPANYFMALGAYKLQPNASRTAGWAWPDGSTGSIVGPWDPAVNLSVSAGHLRMNLASGLLSDTNGLMENFACCSMPIVPPSPTATPAVQCPTGWTRPSGSDRCYKAFDADPGVSFSTFTARCAASAPAGAAAALATIGTPAETAFVVSMRCGVSYNWPWQNPANYFMALGAYKLQPNASRTAGWAWPDGSTGSIVGPWDPAVNLSISAGHLRMNLASGLLSDTNGLMDNFACCSLSLFPSPAATRSGTGTQSGTGSQTGTPSSSATATRSGTSSQTGTPTSSGTATRSGTSSQTGTPSSSATASSSETSSQTGTPSSSATASSSETSSQTSTPSSSATASSSETSSQTGTPSSSSTASTSLSKTPSFSVTASKIPLPSRSATTAATRSRTGSKTGAPVRSTTMTKSRTRSRSSTATRSKTASRTRSRTASKKRKVLL